MANYYALSDVLIFPSNNASDAGKLTDESNLRSILQIVTDYNYKLLSTDFSVTTSDLVITVGVGSACINGYGLVVSNSITVTASTAGTYYLGIKLIFVDDKVIGDNGSSCLGVNVDLFAEEDLTDYTLVLGTAVVGASSITYTEDTLSTLRISSEFLKVHITSENEDYDVQTFLNEISSKYISKVSDDTFAGTLLPTVDNSKNIGSATKKLANIYATTFTGNLTGTATRATGDADGNAIKTTYAKLAAENTFSAANTFTSTVTLSGSGALVFGSYGISSAGIATFGTSRILGLGINTAYDSNYRLKVSGNSLLTGSTYFGTTSNLIDTNGAGNLSTLIARTNLTVGQATIDNSYTLFVTGTGKCTGDFTANRVFNAVYNDIADFVKKDQKQKIEAGDIIAIKHGSDDYVLAERLNSKLVVGVYSDSYGHVMGGENLPNMNDNLKKYAPIAIAGNVKVKILDEIQVGDLITVSAVDGVGAKVTDSFNSIGCIVGKALETKLSKGIGKIKMQVMLA